ncbi:MAG: helix-turn-helix transcriptional regulator [Saprospiraceae bacterium]
MARLRNEVYIACFGNRIRELRLGRGYSQEHLANLCDVELSQINRIELGKINTSISQAYKISVALGVTMSALFDFDLAIDF